MKRTWRFVRWLVIHIAAHAAACAIFELIRAIW